MDGILNDQEISNDIYWYVWKVWNVHVCFILSKFKGHSIVYRTSKYYKSLLFMTIDCTTNT